MDLEKELCFNFINGFADENNMGFCMGYFEFLFLQDMIPKRHWDRGTSPVLPQKKKYLLFGHKWGTIK